MSTTGKIATFECAAGKVTMTYKDGTYKIRCVDSYNCPMSDTDIEFDSIEQAHEQFSNDVDSLFYALDALD